MAGERAAPSRPHSLSPRGLAIAGWAALAVAGAIFAGLAWNVSGHTPLVRLDRQVTAWFAAHRSDAATATMLAISHAHALFAIAMWSLVFAAVLARMLLNLLLKLAYARVRPDLADPLVTLTSYSFPSGHTASAAVFYGVLAAFLVSRLRDAGARIACVVLAFGFVALVALSRVYLGAHHLSDVLAAACSSTVWLVLCLSGVHGLVRRKMDSR